MSAKTVARAAAIIAFFTLLSKILGFVREMVMAYVFGAGAATDAYLVAATIPNIIFAMLGGALATSAVPLFTSFKSQWGEGEAWRLFSVFITVITVIMLGIILVGEPLARQMVWLIAPGLPNKTALLATGLTRVILPSVIFLALGNLFYGLLNANNIFGPPAASQVVTNIVVITGIIAGMGFGIYAAAWGTLIGFGAAMIVQLPYLRKAGFHYYPEWDVHHPGMAEAWRMVVPVLIGGGISQIYMIIDRILASGLVEGSISALNYAQKVSLLPQGLVAVPLATALFPSLAVQADGGRCKEFSGHLVRSVRMLITITMPLAVLLIVLAHPAVELLFMRGAFDAQDAAMTALALELFAIGLIGQCVNPVLTKGFYARQDSVTPLKCGVVAIAINLILSLILIHPLKHGGLALANSLAATFNIFQLGWYLSRSKEGSVSFAGIGSDILKVIVASLGCGAAAWIMDYGLLLLGLAGTLGLIVRVLAAGLAGMGMFVVLCRTLRVSEYLTMREWGLSNGSRLLRRALNRV